jgi:two-component system response regulator (stage 0 sporulation protein F)
MARRVLLADDSRVFRALMTEVLREDGWQVSEAASGRDAYDKAVAERPELLILDGLMPHLSGFEVLTRLRQTAPGYVPCVFIITAVYKSRRWESEARHDYNVNEYLEKPLEPEDLLRAVYRHFPKREDRT